MNIAFLDIETTGLDPRRHEIVEVGIVLRVDNAGLPSRRIHFSLNINPDAADEYALRVNRYHERKDVLAAIQVPDAVGAETLEEALNGALVVGNNVQFDLRFIEQFLLINGKIPTPWYYAPLDLKAYAAGQCGLARPASTKFLEELAGTQVGDEAHSAFVDAEWNERVYDALVIGQRYRVGA